jgi:TetR/AcrR family transcriptional regulator
MSSVNSRVQSATRDHSPARWDVDGRIHLASSDARLRGHQERESELLEAALDQFVERGFAAARMEDIAAKAGVAKGTPYLYFSSKEVLLQTVISRLLCSRIVELESRIRRQIDSVCAGDLILRDIADWWKQIFDSKAGGIYKLLVADVPSLPKVAAFCATEVVSRKERLLEILIDRGIRQGEFQPMHIDSAIHALTLPLFIICVHRNSFGLLSSLERPLDAHAFIDQHFKRIVQGLRSAS